MYMYMNGECLVEEEARISPFDHGFLYGLGVFETFRIYDGHPFLLGDHIDRINHGLMEMNINYHCDRTELVAIVKELLLLNNLEDARVRLNISAGIAPLGLTTTKYENPNILIFMQPILPPSHILERKAVILNTPRNTPETNVRLKSHHYFNNIKAKRELGEKQDYEGIFLTKEGYVAEGIASNLFWIKGKMIFTPCIDTGILNGITRKFVIQLAKQAGFTTQEGFYTVKDVLTAEEVFYTNSVQEIVAVSEIEMYREFPGQTGDAVMLLFEQYSKYRTSLWSMAQCTEGDKNDH
jgi:4-amino-4-deoxychorismate lyase